MKRKYNFLLVLFAAAAFGAILISCGKDSNTVLTPTTPTPISVEEGTPVVDLATVRKNIATNVAAGIIIPAYEKLKANTADLVVKVETFNNEPTENNLTAARTALKNSWLAWQGASIYMFGPAESVALRKSLNTYPTDVSLLHANIQSGDYIFNSLANQAAIGFPALDYLLNGMQMDDTEFVEEYKSKETATASKQYLQELAVDIDDRVSHTLNDWLPTEGNYMATFTEADALGIDVGSSLSILVNSIDLHFQRFARDGKVAIPAGIRSAGVPRPKAIEALYGGYAVELLQANLAAYENLYMGIAADDRDKESLHDYLVAIDAKDLADDMQLQFDAAQAAANDLSDPFGDQIATDVDKVTIVFIEMQKLVVFFKSDMASLMGISNTNQDNDGD